MSIFLIDDRDRSIWQRRAAGELVKILAAHAGLPAIAWTVGPAGSVLVGQVNALAPADRVLAHFQMWRRALGIVETADPASSADEVMDLNVGTVRNQVKVRLLATVIGGIS